MDQGVSYLHVVILSYLLYSIIVQRRRVSNYIIHADKPLNFVVNLLMDGGVM